MEKGRFYRVKNGLNDKYFRLLYEGMWESLYIPSNRSDANTPTNIIPHEYYSSNEEAKPTEITDFCNNICFEILRAHGLEYNKDTDKIENVVYLWDANLVPGERFIGVNIITMTGNENKWSDFFGNIKMSVDILSSFDSELGYRGVNSSENGTYYLYLPYTEDNLLIYQQYTEYTIDKRNNGLYSSKIPRKIKI